jgi:hypothetical protein
MQDDIFQTPAYQKIASSTIDRTIRFLFDNNKEFSLACEAKYLNFEPELPPHIKETFGETVLFILTGYTYETAQIDDEYFSFEAGFGEESFGSTVTLPILAIKQMFVGEYPILFNICNPVIEDEVVFDPEEIDTSKSMAALLNNPENKKFLKKK